MFLGKRYGSSEIFNGDINMLKAGFDNLMKSYELEEEKVLRHS